jgi:hypothetical protein
MSFTVFGLIAVLVGGYLIFQRGLNGPLIFILACSLLGGAAALKLPALGGSTIPPAYFALGFLVIRVAMSPDIRRAGSAVVYSTQTLLIIYAVYTAITALLLPKIFAGQMNVSAMRVVHFAGSEREQLVPLGFSSQNLTTAVYLIGTMLTSICGMFVCMRPQSQRVLIPASVVIAWIFICSGIADVALTHLGHRNWLDVFRNGSYAQLDQSYSGFVRIQGLFPEASAYSSYGFCWLIFMVELWLRNVRPWSTGLAALGLGAILAVSTSTSAYVSLVAYALLVLLRILVFQKQLGVRKGFVIVVCVATFATLGLGWAAINNHAATAFTDMIEHMTVKKGQSVSGAQRGFWMRQGLNAFALSHGLGVGAGSFRSSSLFTAIAGSTGVVGLITFHAYLIQIIKPLRLSTYAAAPNETMAAGAAAAWAAVFGLLPLEVNGPSPDPGILFAIFAGMALAWRLAPATAAKPSTTATAQSARLRPAYPTSPAAWRAEMAGGQHPPIPSNGQLRQAPKGG